METNENQKMTLRDITELLMSGLTPCEIVEAVNNSNEKPVNLSGVPYDCDVEHNAAWMIQHFGNSVRITTTFSNGLTKFELNANNVTTVTRYFRNLTVTEYELLCRLAQYINKDLTREF